MTTQRRQLQKWSSRTDRLHRSIGRMVINRQNMNSTRFWQLRGNVLGTRVLQLGDSIRGRNNR